MLSSSEHAHILHGSKPDVSPINVETIKFVISLLTFFCAIYFIGVLFRCDIYIIMLNNLNNSN